MLVIATADLPTPVPTYMNEFHDPIFRHSQEINFQVLIVPG